MSFDRFLCVCSISDSMWCRKNNVNVLCIMTMDIKVFLSLAFFLFYPQEKLVVTVFLRFLRLSKFPLMATLTVVRLHTSGVFLSQCQCFPSVVLTLLWIINHTNENAIEQCVQKTLSDFNLFISSSEYGWTKDKTSHKQNIVVPKVYEEFLTSRFSASLLSSLRSMTEILSYETRGLQTGADSAHWANMAACESVTVQRWEVS